MEIAVPAAPGPRTYETAAPPKPVVARARLNVDNPTSAELAVWVDGQKAGTIRPYGVFALTVDAGLHELKVTRGAEEVDLVRAKMLADRVTLFSPKGRGRYVLMNATSSQRIEGKALFDADFGLLDHRPISPGSTKISRAVSTPPSPDEAMAYLTCENESIYAAGGLEPRACIDALATAGPTPEVAAALASCIETRTPSVIAAAMAAADRLGVTFPDDRMAGWFSITLEACEPFEKARFEWALQHAIERKRTAMLTGVIAKADRPTQDFLMRRISADFPEMRNGLLATRLKATTAYDHERARTIIAARDFKLDAAVVKTIDAHVDGITETGERKAWKYMWLRKLCENAEDLPRGVIVPRVTGFIQGAAGLKQEFNDLLIPEYAIAALLRLEEAEALIALYPGLSVELRRDLFKTLAETVRQTKKLPERLVPLVTLGSSDTDTSVKRSTAGLLGTAARSNPNVEKALIEELKAEADPARREAKEQAVYEAMLSRLQGASREELEAAAVTAPVRRVVLYAVDRLANHGREALEALIPKLGALGAASRAWLIEGLIAERAFDHAAEDFKAACAAALGDASAELRAAAARGLMSRGGDVGPDVDRVAKAIAKETDAERKAALEKQFDAWVKTCIVTSNVSKPEVVRAMASLYTTAKDDARIAILNRVLYAEGDDVVALLKKALDDKLASLRWSAFTRLDTVARGRKDEKSIRSSLKACAAREKDGDLKKKMDARLK